MCLAGNSVNRYEKSCWISGLIMALFQAGVRFTPPEKPRSTVELIFITNCQSGNYKLADKFYQISPNSIKKALINSSSPPSITDCTFEVSTPVLKSLTSL